MYTAPNEQAIWPAAIASIIPPRTRMNAVSPVATPLSMMCPLMLGSTATRWCRRAAAASPAPAGRETGPDRYGASARASGLLVARADAVQQQRHDLVRGHRSVGEPRVRARERQRAQEPGRLLGRATDLVAVGLEQPGQRGAQPRVVHLRR